MAKQQAKTKEPEKENIEQKVEQEVRNETKEVATVASNNVPTAYTPNPFEEVGREAARPLVGDLLKFSKGEWLAGQENMEIPMGTRMIANMDMLMRGWVRWDDNKPAEQIMGLVAEGFVMPRRQTLGWGYDANTKKEEDADQSDWEVDEQTGRARDPWQETFYLPLRELDKDGNPLVGEGLYTFAGSSTGGKDAVKELCGVYGKAMRFHPGDFPVVALGYSSYEHSNPQYGKIKTPEFVIGYVTSEQARAKKKVKLFDVNKSWIAKELFGDIAEGQSEDNDEGGDGNVADTF